MLQILRILAARHFGFDKKNCTTMTIDNILPILEKKFKVKVIWFFYLPEKNQYTKIDSNLEVEDVHDYNNAVELLKKTKPDIILDNDYPSLMDLAIDVAARHLKIPVITRMIVTDRDVINKKQLFTSFLPMFFHQTMPFETSEKKQFMRRGRFFIFKYYFLFKTLRATKMNFLKIIKYLFIVLNWHISYHIPYIDLRFSNTLHFLENEELKNEMLQKGFPISKLLVTGNPIYDQAFKKYSNFNANPIENKKIRVLFAPIQYYEGGLWTKKERDLTVKHIIKKISSKKDFSLIVKLHPSSESLDEYESLIHSVNESVKIFQKGVITDYFDDIDVVVSYAPVISSLIFALIANKPLILCNFFNFKYQNLLEEDVAWECKDPEKLINLIYQALSNFPKNKNKVENYLKKIMYKTDGKASERLCQAIEMLVVKHQEEKI